MKTNAGRFQKAISMFPKVRGVLARLDAADIPYAIGGSVALYAQGNGRLPHDVDVMFVNDAHDAADVVFGLTSEVIKRPNVSMHKSTPVDDGSIDFLSHYTVIADGVAHHHPPIQKVPVEFEGRQVDLIPAEKIVAIKLIGRRQHHHDLDDVKELMQHADFDQTIFWEMVDLLNAYEVVTELIDLLHIQFRK
jgi:hypothetical protein